MIAALLFVLTCTGDVCEGYDVARWDNPTPAELKQCSDQAQSRRDTDEQATCEIVPMDGAEPAVGIVTIGPLEFPERTHF